MFICVQFVCFQPWTIFLNLKILDLVAGVGRKRCAANKKSKAPPLEWTIPALAYKWAPPSWWWTNSKFQSDSSSRSATSWVVFASCIAGGELHQWWPQATIRHLKWKLKTIGFLLRAKPAADMKDLLFKLSFKELFLEKLSEGGRKGLCPFYLSYFKTENVPFHSKFTFFSEHNFHKCLIGSSSASLIPR